MPPGGIIEHGAPVAAGAEAAAGGLTGLAQGLLLRQRLQAQRLDMREQRMKLSLIEEQAGLEREQREAGDQLARMRAGDYSGAELDEIELGDLTPAERELYPKLDDEGRAALDEENLQRRTARIVQGQVEQLDGRVAMMEQGIGFYQRPEGLGPSSRMQEALAMARDAVEQVKAGLMDPQEASQIVRAVSAASLEEKHELEDEILTAQVLTERLTSARQAANTIGDEASPQEEFLEWVMQAYAGGEISGRLARAYSRAGKEGTDAIIEDILEKTGALEVHRPGTSGGSGGPDVPRGTPDAPPAGRKRAAKPVDLFGSEGKDEGRLRVLKRVLEAAADQDLVGAEAILANQGLDREQTEDLSAAVADEIRRTKGQKSALDPARVLKRIRSRLGSMDRGGRRMSRNRPPGPSSASEELFAAPEEREGRSGYMDRLIEERKPEGERAELEDEPKPKKKAKRKKKRRGRRRPEE